MTFGVVVALAFAGPLFGQHADPHKTPPPPPFVEGSIPDGKALIYIYRVENNLAGEPSFDSPLLLANNEPFGVIPAGCYYSYVSDPGTITLWFVSSSAASLKLEAVAGQIYYVRAGFDTVLTFNSKAPFKVSLKVMPRPDAMKELAYCKPFAE